MLVGQVTIIKGKGDHAARTGVTAVLANKTLTPVFAAVYTHNGDGEMTGSRFIEEKGHLISPIILTNTVSVGAAHQAVIKWSLKKFGPPSAVNLPVVAETWDGWLNDIYGFHVKEHHVLRALAEARGGAVAEGNEGGGTGMICHGFKGGIGTASRKVLKKAGGYTVGVRSINALPHKPLQDILRKHHRLLEKDKGIKRDRGN